MNEKRLFCFYVIYAVRLVLVDWVKLVGGDENLSAGDKNVCPPVSLGCCVRVKNGFGIERARYSERPV